MFTEDQQKRILSGEFSSRREVYDACGGRSRKKIIWLNEHDVLVPKTYTSEDVLREIRRHASELGEPPTSSQVGSALLCRAQNKFGSWNEALYRATGKYKQKRYAHLSNDDLKEILIGFVKKYQRLPLRSEFNGERFPDYETYVRRFGCKNWTEVIGTLSLEGITYYSQHGMGKIHSYEGRFFLSHKEYLIGRWLINQHIVFEQEVPYGGKTNFRFDFYLPLLGAYVEYYGLSHIPEYAERIKEKQRHYCGRRVIEIYKHDNILKKLALEVQRLYDSSSA